MLEKEYISKDYALYLVNYFGNMLTWSKDDIISEIKRKITEESAADVAPVRHGHWEEFDEEGCYSCSVCGNPWIIIDGTPQDNEMYFCPNCGAKMDEKEREENEV